MKITNIDDLIYHYYEKNPNGHYFDPETLRFFGERKSDMRLLKGTHRITSVSGETYTTYKISRLQRNHPLGPTRTYAYFDVDTLKDIMFF